MRDIPSDCFYTESHEWLRLDHDDIYELGVTEHAQHLLGDLVFVELPDVGDHVKAGEELGVVESVKAASDYFTPITGEVMAVNTGLEDAPGLVNSDPYGDGWLVKIQLADAEDLDDLLSPEDYAELIETADIEAEED